jgi:glucan phosphoethanolaminetransferase (alkaline phosphatase superfamily)
MKAYYILLTIYAGLFIYLLSIIMFIKMANKALKSKWKWINAVCLIWLVLNTPVCYFKRWNITQHNTTQHKL